MRPLILLTTFGVLGLALVTPPGRSAEPSKPVLNPAPSVKDWADLAKLPDWSGVWVPDRKHRNFRFGSVRPSFTPAAAAYIAEQEELVRAGTPNNIYINCLPEGMPSNVIMSRSASEYLFTPGRVTILGENDGTRLRRIYTDGRPHPEDPDLTFNGHSIGRWDGDTLVVETTGFHPLQQMTQFVSLGGAWGKSDSLRVVERFVRTGPNVIFYRFTVHDPLNFTAPWTGELSMIAMDEQIYEYACHEGNYALSNVLSGARAMEREAAAKKPNPQE